MRTQRLELRRFLPKDWEQVHAYLSDPEVVAFEPYDPKTPEESREFAAFAADSPDFWAVCLEGVLIGQVYFSKGEQDTWELGYVFHRGYWGRGFAVEACRALLGEAFRSWGAHRAEANCDPGNSPSWRLLERLGFRREGVFLENVFFRRDGAGNPVWKDTYTYGLLSREWLEKEA